MLCRTFWRGLRFNFKPLEFKKLEFKKGTFCAWIVPLNPALQAFNGRQDEVQGSVTLRMLKRIETKGHHQLEEGLDSILAFLLGPTDPEEYIFVFKRTIPDADFLIESLCFHPTVPY